MVHQAHPALIRRSAERVGDLIVAIDGVPVCERGCRPLHERDDVTLTSRVVVP
ncbi:MAG: hypothetical protein GY716_20115 [bacterium]|nr:hypothetical protein [bacterium]